MLRSLLTASCLATLAAAGDKTCQIESAYPPPANSTIEWKIVDLDAPAKDRWTAIVAPLAAEIKTLTGVITGLLPDKIIKPILAECALVTAPKVLDRLPGDMGDELRGIHEATGEDMCTLLFYNLAYEVLGGCTSIIAEDPSGHMFHARNLDFGLGPFNATEMQWQLTDALRPLLVNVDFQKGGKTLYKSTHYAGYVGVLTAVKQGAFSITVDSRFDSNYDKFLLQWFRDPTDTAAFLGFLTREVIETVPDYAGALEQLTSTDMVGPSYVILGGINAGEGVVITNAPNSTTPLNVWDIAHGRPLDAPFYVLQTNYDNWVDPPFFDDRRTPAMDCMDKLGSAGITKESMYNVLHAHPNRNRLTTYTTLLDAASGDLESSIQWCEEEGCVAW